MRCIGPDQRPQIHSRETRSLEQTARVYKTASRLKLHVCEAREQTDYQYSEAGDQIDHL